MACNRHGRRTTAGREPRAHLDWTGLPLCDREHRPSPPSRQAHRPFRRRAFARRLQRLSTAKASRCSARPAARWAQPADLGNYTDAEALQDARAARARASSTASLTLRTARRRASRARVHVLPPLQRLSSTSGPASLQVGRRHRRADARARARRGARRVHVSRPAAIARRCSARWRRASTQHHPPLRLSDAAVRLVLVVLLRPARHGAAGARQPRRHRASDIPGLKLHPDRRRLSAGDGRLARDRRGVRRRRAGRAEADPRARLRAGDLGGAVHRRRRVARCSSSIPTGSSRTPTARRCAPIDVTFGGWRRGPWYALDGTHPGGAGASRDASSARCATSGAAPTSSSTPTSGARFTAGASTIRARRASRPIGAAWRRCCAARGDGFILGCNHPIWPSLGVIHGSRSSNDIKRDVGARQRHRAAEPEPQLAERRACGGTIPTRSC